MSFVTNQGEVMFGPDDDINGVHRKPMVFRGHFRRAVRVGAAGSHKLHEK